MLPLPYDMQIGSGMLLSNPLGIMLQVVPENTRIPFFCGKKSDMAMPHNPRIPTPPLGRQIVMTFPSIYKEKDGGLVNTGQLYPPRAV
jgi:hypothetical protein